MFDGNWDIEDKRPLEEYLSDYIYSKTVFQLLRDDVPYSETEQYEEISRFVQRGYFASWQARGCKTHVEIERYFKRLRGTFNEIRTSGYKTQEALGKSTWFDEIKVFIDRHGEIHKQQGAGHHRLAMAIILRVPKVPVLVIGVHRQWALVVQREVGADVLTSIDRKLKQIADQG